MTDASAEASIADTLVEKKLRVKAEVDAILDGIEKQVEAQDTVAGGLVLFIGSTAKFFASRAVLGDIDAVIAGAERLDATATLMAEAMIENTEVDPAGDGPDNIAITKLEEIGNNTAEPTAASDDISHDAPAFTPDEAAANRELETRLDQGA